MRVRVRVGLECSFVSDIRGTLGDLDDDSFQLPQLLNFFEKACYLKDINHELFSQAWSPLARNLPGTHEEGAATTATKDSRPPYLQRFVKPGDVLVSRSG